MSEHRNQSHREWQMNITVERREDGPFLGTFWIQPQTISKHENSVPIQAPFEQHGGGPYGTPDLAFSEGFKALESLVDRMIDQEQQTP